MSGPGVCHFTGLDDVWIGESSGKVDAAMLLADGGFQHMLKGQKTRQSFTGVCTMYNVFKMCHLTTWKRRFFVLGFPTPHLENASYDL